MGTQTPSIDDLGHVDLDAWHGQRAMEPILAMLRYCPKEPCAEAAFQKVSTTLAAWWKEAHSGRRQNIRTGDEWLSNLAKFVLGLDVARAKAVCQPIAEAVGTAPGEVEGFITNLIFAADALDTAPTFWPLWEWFGEHVLDAGWITRLDARHSPDRELLRAMFLGIPWNKGVRHWRHLEGCADLVGMFFETLPPAAPVIEAYTRFLFEVGGRSLPEAFIPMEQRIRAGNVAAILADGNTVFLLESILKRYVYGAPEHLKANPPIRDAVLSLLNLLVDGGSSAAYRMRDDFVTPWVPSGNRSHL